MAKKNHKGSVTTTRDAALAAAALCRENAQRFSRNARLLLNAGGSDGLIYVLWSFGIEEVGKGILLERQTAAASATGAIPIRDSWSHEEKFEAGLQAIPRFKGSMLERVLRVRQNQASKGSVVEDSLRPGEKIAVPAFATGMFSDGSGSGTVDATVQLRFALLYVDWSPASKRWVRPGETIRNAGLEARWELKHEDLVDAMDALAHHIGDTT